MWLYLQNGKVNFYDFLAQNTFDHKQKNGKKIFSKGYISIFSCTEAPKIFCQDWGTLGPKVFGPAWIQSTENFEETLETADIQKKYGIHDLLLNPQNIDNEQDAVDYLTIDLLSKKQDKHSNRRNRLFN